MYRRSRHGLEIVGSNNLSGGGGEEGGGVKATPRIQSWSSTLDQNVTRLYAKVLGDMLSRQVLCGMIG